MRSQSPFPGMDPCLESPWGGVHLRFIAELQSQLVPQLPEDLFAEVEETVYMLDPIPEEPIVEGHIKIRQLSDGNPLVTAIEVFSPTNKSTVTGRAAYLIKRKSYHNAGANLVEIDLLRGGDHLFGHSLAEWATEKPQLASAYRCTVRNRKLSDSRMTIHPIELRQRLPGIQIQLRLNEPMVTIDLQQPIDLVYKLGSYGRRIDYSAPPRLPLSPEDTVWAAELISKSI